MSEKEEIRNGIEIAVVGVVEGIRIGLKSGDEYRINVNGQPVWVTGDQILGMIGKIRGRHESKG